MKLTFQTAKQMLEKHNQGHILAFWPKLDGTTQESLLNQVASLDMDTVAQLKTMLSANAAASRDEIAPAPVLDLKGADRNAAKSAGEAAIRAGRVGVILVAGGQGSRLGFEGPKGCYKIGPITDAPLFHVHARKILALEKKYNARIPLYIMTSDTNDAETRNFFKTHKYFGLSSDRVLFFVQGMWPALFPDGRLVLEAPGRMFMSPDGHGGVLRALKERGMFDDMRRRNVETLFYFQVDNPLVEVADPVFIGIHESQNAEASIKVCAKRDAAEGLGVTVVRNGRNAIVEYTELTDEQKNAAGPDGKLRFLYGSVAIHVFSRAFLEQEANGRMPVHLAHKKVAFCDTNGNLVKPDKPNAFKFEKFIFDVLPDARRSVNLVFLREEEFSPVKNASGADSPETTRRDMMLKWARWFDACGIKVQRKPNGTPAHKIEIDPCYALDADDLKRRLPKGFTVTGDVNLQA